MITVRYMGILREITGKDFDEIHEDSIILEDLLRRISLKYGEDFIKGFIHACKKRSAIKVHVLVDGEIHEYPRCSNAVLKSGNEVVLIPIPPMVFGG